MEQQVDAIFAAQRKVYCGACCYYVPWLATPHGLLSPECRHRNARQTVETYEGFQAVRISPEQRNANKDCQDWRRATFFSDIGHNAFKRVMCLFAACGVAGWLMACLIRMLMP
jgi:hypothetical protein